MGYEREQIRKKRQELAYFVFILSIVIILESIPAMTTHVATTEDIAALRAMLLEMLETGDGSRHYVYDWNLREFLRALLSKCQKANFQAIRRF